MEFVCGSRLHCLCPGGKDESPTYLFSKVSESVLIPVSLHLEKSPSGPWAQYPLCDLQWTQVRSFFGTNRRKWRIQFVSSASTSGSRRTTPSWNRGSRTRWLHQSTNARFQINILEWWKPRMEETEERKKMSTADPQRWISLTVMYRK